MMRFAPIPTKENHLLHFKPQWWPLLQKIEQRGESLEVLLQKIDKGLLQLCMAWDDETEKAKGLLGIQYRKEGEDMIAELVHLTGEDMEMWKPLLPELHKFLKDHVGCACVRATVRRGLAPWLADQDYKVTKYIMEHRL